MADRELQSDLVSLKIWRPSVTVEVVSISQGLRRQGVVEVARVEEAGRVADGVRNLRPLTLEPREPFNVFSGDNGQCNPNLLEAIFVIAALRSFRTAKLSELVAFGEDRARLGARVWKDDLVRRYEVAQGTRKVTRIVEDQEVVVDVARVEEAGAHRRGYEGGRRCRMGRGAGGVRIVEESGVAVDVAGVEEAGGRRRCRKRRGGREVASLRIWWWASMSHESRNPAGSHR